MTALKIEFRLVKPVKTLCLMLDWANKLLAILAMWCVCIYNGSKYIHFFFIEDVKPTLHWSISVPNSTFYGVWGLNRNLDEPWRVVKARRKGVFTVSPFPRLTCQSPVSSRVGLALTQICCVGGRSKFIKKAVCCTGTRVAQ